MTILLCIISFLFLLGCIFAAALFFFGEPEHERHGHFDESMARPSKSYFKIDDYN